MADFSSGSGDFSSLLPMEKDAAKHYIDNDDLTTPTAAPSRSLDSIDAPLKEGDQYNACEEEAATLNDDTASFPPQSSDVFHCGAKTCGNENATNVSVAPTFPSDGALGRFDSDYGDEESQDAEESSLLGEDDCSDDTSFSEEMVEEQENNDGEAASSLQHATEPVRRRSSGGNICSGAFMPQSFRPFQSRNSEDNPINVSFKTDDIATTEAEDFSNRSNNTAPQCRHTPSIITSSEASYIFQQLDELRTAPSGITYNQPKYLKPSNVISGNEFADLLPNDAIHAISSYCDGKSWMSLCHTSKQWRVVGCEVFRKVRMHAFRCAGEVLLAWAQGEHADARQLAALYIKNGVPIYPAPLGHAYHTLSWKMGLEIDAKQSSDNEEKKDDLVDRFYAFRYKHQDDENDVFPAAMLTYVEEKCTYWKDEKGIKSGDTMRTPEILSSFAAAAADDGALPTRSSTVPFHYRRNSFSAPDAGVTSTGDNSLPLMAISDRSDRHSITTTTAKIPKMTIRIHRHLADQHFFGASSTDDEGGDMNGVACNLNADFFHPQWERKKCCTSSNHFGRLLGGGRHHHWHRQQQRWGLLDGNLMDTFRIDFGVTAFEAALEDARRALAIETPLANSASSQDGRRGSSFLRYDSLPSHNNSSPRDSNDTSSNRHYSPASDVHLEIYSLSSSTGGKSDTEEERKLSEVSSRVRSRCARYRLKLESFLANFDTLGFDECLLDLWDEIFPLSKGIHFYNRQTAVPRMSSLERFMTTPLPKAVGVMQCEIERVKTTSRVKGRLFPTYEYRLFIRDTKNENTDNIPNFPPRKDSVLLVAKNKNGRRNVGAVDSADAVTKTTTSKRGVNNYYLYLPQQRDVDMHYKSANEHLRHSSGATSGLSVSTTAAQSTAAIQVGRLQSNFIGTEFQIFSSPKMVKVEGSEEAGRQSQRSSSSQESDCQPEHGDQVHPAPDNLDTVVPVTAPRRSSGRRRGNSLVRFARRASNGLSRRGRGSNENGGEECQPRKKTLTRRVSWGSSSRPSRRAIANSSEIHGLPPNVQPVMIEEENGAITYTANLLGNRPRIMDVCIPKVLEDGTVSEGWRHTPDDSPTLDDSNCQMLNRFKTIQQERGAVVDDNDVSLDRDSDRNHGLMVFQNRPPWWNVELGAFVLNFGGRVSVASVKNFQLCERRDEDHIMQFGRIQGRHNFTMDFQHPLTPTQAFAIAISSLQSKISFG